MSNLKSLKMTRNHLKDNTFSCFFKENIKAFFKPILLAGPKNSFHQKPTLLPRPKKLAHSLINISVEDKSE